MRSPLGFYSIRSRLILWLLLPISLLGVIAIGITSSLITSQANKVFDRLLLGVAYSIEQRLVHRNGEVILNMPYFTLDVMESASSEKLFYRVQQQSGNLLAGFKGLPKPDNQAHEVQTQEIQYYNTVFAGNDLRAVSLLIPGESPQTTVEIIVAESINGRQGFAENILVVLVLVSLLAMVLMLLAAIYAVHRGLLPLRRLSQRIEQRSEHDLRPLVSSVPKEVSPLVDSINFMMQRTRDNIEHIQQFNADVSHQLRTPLAEIKTLAQLAQQESPLAQQESSGDLTEHSRQLERFRQIEQITDFMSRTTQQLLSYAKTRQSLLDQQMLKPLDLIDFCRQLIMRHVPRIYRQGGEIEFEDFQASSAWIEGDAVMLSGLLINLIDNALYYGALPDQSPMIKVSVQVVPDWIQNDQAGSSQAKQGQEPDDKAGSVILVVEDQGPGIDPEQIESVTSRFVRLDQQRQGSGLGLAIVRQICDFHSADLKLSNRSEARCGEQKQTASGLRVRIRFPLAVKPATET